jgi:hypothetical protein
MSRGYDFQREWAERQRLRREAEPFGGLIEPVVGKVVNFKMTEPLRCEDREFCEDALEDRCNR